MKRIVLIITLLAIGTAHGATFAPTSYLAESSIDVLNRQVARQTVERDLFRAPYATVVVGNIDVYENFPYLEARYFQVVSDPGWNRLVYGAVDRGLQSFDGQGADIGPLSRPRGLATDDQGRVFVADSGNNRIVVMRAVTEFDHMSLEPVFVIAELNEPYDVAFSDGGTPFVGDDDALYVANTGRNEVRRYSLGADGAVLTASLGALGDGVGEFAGPLAVTVAEREGDGNTAVYVADAHNQRLVQLRDDGDGLSWVAATRHDKGTVTALTSDQWGNVYATSPSHGVVKYAAGLKTELGAVNTATRPRDFHVPRVTVTDHRDGTRRRAGEGHGILIEQWDTGSGIRLLNLGVEIAGAAQTETAAAVEMILSDEAVVTTELRDPATGAVVATHRAGQMRAGHQQIPLQSEDDTATWAAGEYQLTIRAESTYDRSRAATVALKVQLAATGGTDLPRHLTLLGNSPNPFNPQTTIRFIVPAGDHDAHSLKIYDTRGRLVRDLTSGPLTAGLQAVVWDGRGDGGDPAGSGVYLYRVVLGDQKSTGKMTLLK